MLLRCYYIEGFSVAFLRKLASVTTRGIWGLITISKLFRLLREFPFDRNINLGAGDIVVRSYRSINSASRVNEWYIIHRITLFPFTIFPKERRLFGTPTKVESLLIYKSTNRKQRRAILK